MNTYKPNVSRIIESDIFKIKSWFQSLIIRYLNPYALKILASNRRRTCPHRSRGVFPRIPLTPYTPLGYSSVLANKC